jgi:hypothetical protein
MVRIGARVSSVTAPLLVAAALLAAPGCGDDEFCAAGSYECTTGGFTSGTGGSAGAGQANGGTSGEAGRAGSGGVGAAGSGGESASGGFAGMAEGGAAGSGDSGAGGGDSGSSGSGGTPANPVPCAIGDFSEGCTLAPDAGIFVSPAGADDSAGTSDAPVASLTAAIEKARSGSRVRPIFVCSATYREHPEIHNDGYAIHGGFACPDDLDAAWTYDSAERAKIAPETQGFALRARDLQGLRVSDLEFIAAGGAAPGDSSIAVFVSNAADVRFERVRIVAADGVDGADGMLEGFEYPAQTELRGNDATGPTGGAAQTECICEAVAVKSTGGRGGDGGSGEQGGGSGGPANLPGGEGGTISADCSVAGGKNGGPAPAAADGNGASEPGAAGPSGWTPADGKAGDAGTPGKGGGGGAGALDLDGVEPLLGGGGGGACGGCGGNSATPGKGGGSSIGLLMFEADVAVVSSTISSASAGNGGEGAGGQVGQNGGTGGNRTGTGCLGGNGGKGGDGGASGGGAGGLSVGIVWSGDTAPDVSGDTLIEPGEFGLGGLGGAPLENDGISGLADDILRLNG